MTREEIKRVKMTNQEAIEILRDTPIDLRSPREDDIHILYARAQMLAIEALQERPKGRWIEEDGNAYCSECNACWGLDKHFDLADHKASHKFCNVCGADMRNNEE